MTFFSFPPSPVKMAGRRRRDRRTTFGPRRFPPLAPYLVRTKGYFTVCQTFFDQLPIFASRPPVQAHDLKSRTEGRFFFFPSPEKLFPFLPLLPLSYSEARATAEPGQASGSPSPSSGNVGPMPPPSSSSRRSKRSRGAWALFPLFSSVLSRW